MYTVRISNIFPNVDKTVTMRVIVGNVHDRVVDFNVPVSIFKGYSYIVLDSYGCWLYKDRPEWGSITDIWYAPNDRDTACRRVNLSGLDREFGGGLIDTDVYDCSAVIYNAKYLVETILKDKLSPSISIGELSI